MAQKPWLVFGLDGRTADDVQAAVQLGYRRFDAAESYGASTDALAEAIGSSPQHRDDFEVLYKFDVRADENREQLRTRLTEVAGKFGGKLDAAVIHNLDGDQAQIRKAWNVMHSMKRQGTIGKAGVGNVLPQHADLLRELKSKDSIDVVELSPHNSREGSQQGSPRGNDRPLGDASSDRSSPLLGVVENSVRGVLADPQLRDLMADLSDRTTLYYYNVVRTLDEIQKHYDRTGNGERLTMKSPEGMTAVAQQTGYRVQGEAHMILTSGNPETMKRNLKTYETDAANMDYPPAEFADAVSKWSAYHEVCRTNDPTPLPDGVQGKLLPLFDNPEAKRGQVVAFAAETAGGKVDRESVSAWLMKEHKFTREELEGVTVPDRVGLLPAYQNMKLADVLAGHLGSQNCNHKWANDLAYPLLHDVDMWKIVAPTLTNIAQPDTVRTPSPLSMADAASLASGNASPARRASNGSPGATGLPPAQPTRAPSPTPGR
ncbi:aldo/keto reductase [Streptomyces sp. NBC_00878]|uniref:aldo/keto reductase n=1 Tax=Streptomyces sp. NBC_00878 TaxID=2975854 RepID=UPI002259E77A|nr:aldo/keto reductase [Streptomyces sp. NBC_00878]MCX4904441.1 aldo/keto reductase [Streptomyces sp. NBC_00878]